MHDLSTPQNFHVTLRQSPCCHRIARLGYTWNSNSAQPAIVETGSPTWRRESKLCMSILIAFITSPGKDGALPILFPKKHGKHHQIKNIFETRHQIRPEYHLRIPQTTAAGAGPGERKQAWAGGTASHTELARRAPNIITSTTSATEGKQS